MAMLSKLCAALPSSSCRYNLEQKQDQVLVGLWRCLVEKLKQWTRQVRDFALEVWTGGGVFVSCNESCKALLK